MILFKLLLWGECLLVRIQGENGVWGFIEAIGKEKNGREMLCNHTEKWKLGVGSQILAKEE